MTQEPHLGDWRKRALIGVAVVALAAALWWGAARLFWGILAAVFSGGRVR